MDIYTDINNHLKAFRTLDIDKLEYFKKLVKQVLREGNKILVAGNGGSASDSAHLVGEIVGKFMIERPGYEAVDLSANNTLLTAIGNDYGYKEVFSRQITSMSKPGDLFVGFTTSGNSENILEAIKEARISGMSIIIISGKDGGKINKENLVTENEQLIIDSFSTPVVQVAHTFVLHQLAWAVDEMFMEDNGNV